MRDQAPQRFFVLECRINERRWQKEMLFAVLFVILLAVLCGPTLFIEHARNVRAIELCVVAYRDSGLPEAEARTAALTEWNNPSKVERFIRKYYDHPERVDDYTLSYFHVHQ